MLSWHLLVVAVELCWLGLVLAVVIAVVVVVVVVVVVTTVPSAIQKFVLVVVVF